MIKTMKVNSDNMKKGAKGGFTNATDVADYLVKKGESFRNAHEISGKIVLYCIDHDMYIEDMSLDTFKTFSNLFAEDVYEAIDLVTCVKERKVIGGPSPDSVSNELNELKKFIEENKKGA